MTQQCINCVLDSTDDPNISFSTEGKCNFCQELEKEWLKYPASEYERIKKLERKVQEIKLKGRGKKYDCLIGLSGGVDSTYVALMVKKYGLRPLAVHVDNGWDSEIAVSNIQNIVSQLGIDLYTIVIDWEEFKDLQLSFLKASVVDLELTTDHAIASATYGIAKRHNIDYIINGFNLATEGILPTIWRWDKKDWLNIKSIHKLFGTRKLKTFPHLNFFEDLYCNLTKSIETVLILNYIKYDTYSATKEIKKILDWKDYGSKHFESIITRFYQAYILPTKFGIDKRRAHLSSLIVAGTITREYALKQLEKPIYNPEQFNQDKQFVLKKFSLSEKEFENIMNLPIRPHNYYSNYRDREYYYHEKILNKINQILGRKIKT